MEKLEEDCMRISTPMDGPRQEEIGPFPHSEKPMLFISQETSTLQQFFTMVLMNTEILFTHFVFPQ